MPLLTQYEDPRRSSAPPDYDDRHEDYLYDAMDAAKEYAEMLMVDELEHARLHPEPAPEDLFNI